MSTPRAVIVCTICALALAYCLSSLGHVRADLPGIDTRPADPRATDRQPAPHLPPAPNGPRAP